MDEAKSGLDRGLARLISVEKRSAISSGCLSCISRILAVVCKRWDSVLWVVPEKSQVPSMERELATFSPRTVLHFPSYEHQSFLPLVPAMDTSAQRVKVLHELGEEGNGILVVTEARCLLEKVIPRNKLSSSIELLMAEEEVDRQALLEWLIAAGYERVSRVKRLGEFCVRGEVMDVFSPNHSLPLRLVFFDDLIEEIRIFDPDDQRTVGRLKETLLLPVRETVFLEAFTRHAAEDIIEYSRHNDWPSSFVADILKNLEARRYTEASLSLMPFLYGELDSIFDYLPANSLIVLQDPLLVAKELSSLFWSMVESHERQVALGRPLKGHGEYFLDLEQLNRKLMNRNLVFLNPHDILNPPVSELSVFYQGIERMELTGCHKLELTGISPKGKKGAEVFSEFFAQLNMWQEEGKRVILTAQDDSSFSRLEGILSHYMKPFRQVDVSELVKSDGRPFAESEILVMKGYVQEAFLDENDALVFIPDHKIFRVSSKGDSVRRRKADKGFSPVSLDFLHEGDYIVHRDYGIGRFLGLVKMEHDGLANEFVAIEYHGGDRLYLPVDRLALLQRYVGIEGREPRLDRLGAKTWQNRKSRVKKKIQEIAHELVELYAARKVSKGVSIDPPDEMYRQFEMAFPFEETRDQKKAIEEIMEDLQAEYPMDRLLCGDVGFGKTEVAMRAAFLTVQSGYQVAVLVPTTLLAEQHERTFRERFRDFPVNIASISRMKAKALQRDIIARVKAGEIDILIGTHRILQADVAFSKLGLVIIDEEHRFGVRHKERLKLMTRNTNALALTATPIPRTLQLSLLGIRDLSIMEIPPEGRMSVKTFLAEFDDSIVKGAIEREVSRGGQIFFVHNRIKGIYRMAEYLQGLVNGVRIDVAHGQMDPSELEEKMVRFIQGETDCLLCTTIIESGIDIPSANTLIVNMADRLGIADLYQLRGRVGRSSRQAYAYLLVSRLEDLGRDASKRLKAIMETGELGGGMSLAMQDLKIRGAGNLLGVTQAGQIGEVGYDLYLDLLKEAIDAFKGKEVQERPDPEVHLGVSAYVPEEYCPDVHERMELYRWFGHIDTERDRDEIAEELEDRFGKIPEEVWNLLNVMVIKSFLRQMNCIRLDVRSSGTLRLIFGFGPDGPENFEKLLDMVKTDGRFKILQDGRLFFELKNVEKERFDLLEKIITILKYMVQNSHIP